MSSTQSARLAACLVGLSLIAASCGGSSSDAQSESAAEAEAATSTSATDTDASAGDASEAAEGEAADQGGLDTLLPPLGDEEIEISFESYNFLLAGAGADAMHELLDEFEAAYPTITIERRSPSSIADLIAGLQQQIVVGDAPTVAQVTFATDLLANDLGARPWGEVVGDDTMAAYFDGSLDDQYAVHPRAATLGDLNGETYAVPFVFSTPTLFMNRTLLAEAGIDPETDPETWAEVTEMATSVTEATDAQGFYQACTGSSGFGWCYQAALKSNGATPISADLTQLDFDSAESIEVATMFADMVEAGIMPDVSDADAADLFLRGELAMYLQSAIYTGAVLGASEAGGWEMDATGLPAFGDQAVVPTNSGSGLGLFTDDPAEQRAAWELVKFLTSNEAYTTITSKIGYLPLRTGIVEDDAYLAGWLTEHEFLQDNLDQLDQLEPWLIPPGANGSQITTVWMDAVNEVIYRGADAASTLTEAEEVANGLMP